MQSLSSQEFHAAPERAGSLFAGWAHCQRHSRLKVAALASVNSSYDGHRGFPARLADPPDTAT